MLKNGCLVYREGKFQVAVFLCQRKLLHNVPMTWKYLRAGFFL